MRCEQEIGAAATSMSCRSPLSSASRRASTSLATHPFPGDPRRPKPLDRRGGRDRRSRLEISRLVEPAGEANQAEILGDGADAAPPVVDLLESSGWRRELYLVEHAAASRRGLAAGAGARRRAPVE